jgi:hypothetical protein
MRTFNGATQVSNATLRTDNAGNLEIFTGTTGDSKQMTITSGGNIGMGTTGSPISAGTYYTTLELKGRTGGSGNEGGYYLTTDADGSTIGQLGVDGNFVYLGSRSNTDAVITSNNSERIRVFAGGNVHIGTVGATDAGFKLDVNGTGRFSGALTGTSATFSGFVGVNGSPATAFPLEAYINSSTTYTSSSRGNVFRVFNTTTSTNTFAGIEFAIEGNANAAVAGINGIWTGSGSAALSFYTRDSSTFSERMRITSGGNVGIGTASPASYSRLEVSGTAGAQIDAAQQLVITAPTTTAGHGAGLRLNAASGAKESVGIIGMVNEASGNLGAMTFHTYGGGANIPERMRITSSGQIVMGRTTPSAAGRLTVDGDLYLHNITSGAGNSTLKYNYTSTGLVTYDTSSRLLKKNIENLSYGLEDVLKMSAKKYNWKRDESIDLGFIADEMVKIIPEIVFFSTQMTNQTTGVPVGEPLSINYDRLIPVLVKAIQELKQEIDTLKS